MDQEYAMRAIASGVLEGRRGSSTGGQSLIRLTSSCSGWRILAVGLGPTENGYVGEQFIPPDGNCLPDNFQTEVVALGNVGQFLGSLGVQSFKFSFGPCGESADNPLP
jgi:hypothetical protein